MPVLFSLQTQSEHDDSMLQLPAPLQSMTQSPPGQFKFVEPAPVEVTLHPPCGHSRLQEPVPLQRNAHPLPEHVRSHEPVPSHTQGAPGAHDGESGFVVAGGSVVDGPLEPLDDVSGALFWSRARRTKRVLASCGRGEHRTCRCEKRGIFVNPTNRVRRW
jgi:hypothetical protein